MSDVISSEEKSCGNCQYWQGARAKQGGKTILESYDGDCPIAKRKKERRSGICFSFVKI